MYTILSVYSTAREQQGLIILYMAGVRKEEAFIAKPGTNSVAVSFQFQGTGQISSSNRI
jgi:hypothetical protein